MYTYELLIICLTKKKQYECAFCRYTPHSQYYYGRKLLIYKHKYDICNYFK